MEGCRWVSASRRPADRTSPAGSGSAFRKRGTAAPGFRTGPGRRGPEGGRARCPSGAGQDAQRTCHTDRHPGVPLWPASAAARGGDGRAGWRSPPERGPGGWEFVVEETSSIRSGREGREPGLVMAAQGRGTLPPGDAGSHWPCQGRLATDAWSSKRTAHHPPRKGGWRKPRSPPWRGSATRPERRGRGGRRRRRVEAWTGARPRARLLTKRGRRSTSSQGWERWWS